MCGIAGVHIKPNAKGKSRIGHLMDNLFMGIESRGKDATGFISVTFDNQILLDKGAVPASKFVKNRKSIKNNTQTVLLHTRLATQGHQSNAANNHPVQYGTTFVTHNGVIWNDRELFEEHDWERNAEVDTVAIPAMLWDMCDGGNFGNAGKALEKIDGMMAIAAIDVKMPGTVLLARGYSSPLVYIETPDMFIWASTIAAIKHAWSQVFGTPPSDDKFVTVNEGEMFIIENGVMTKSEFDYQVHNYNYNYGTWTKPYDNDWGWGAKDDYSYPSKSMSNKRGYWVTDNGYRRWVEMGATPIGITNKDLLTADEYTEWAEADMQIQREAFAIIAEDYAMSPDLVEWIIMYAPQNVLDGDVSMAAIHIELERDFKIAYDDLCTTYSVPKAEQSKNETLTFANGYTVTPQNTDAILECVDCGDELHGDNIYRCNLCMVENVDSPLLAEYNRALDNDSDLALIETTTGGE